MHFFFFSPYEYLHLQVLLFFSSSPSTTSHLQLQCPPFSYFSSQLSDHSAFYCALHYGDFISFIHSKLPISILPLLLIRLILLIREIYETEKHCEVHSGFHCIIQVPTEQLSLTITFLLLLNFIVDSKIILLLLQVVPELHSFPIQAPSLYLLLHSLPS